MVQQTLNSFLTAANDGTLVSSVSDRTSERRSGDVFMVDLWLARETEQRDTQRCCCLPGFYPAVYPRRGRQLSDQTFTAVNRNPSQLLCDLNCLLRCFLPMFLQAPCQEPEAAHRRVSPPADASIPKNGE